MKRSHFNSLFNAQLVFPLLLFAVLAVYVPHLENGFIFDDHQQITMNPLVRGDRPWVEIFTQGTWAHVENDAATLNRYYRPLFTLAHRLAYQAGDGQPWAFHLLNLGLHLLATLLVVTALRRLDFSRSAALAAAALFALHPLAAEAVYWASCTSELLVQIAMLLVLVGMLEAQRGSPIRRVGCLFVAVLALLSGLLAKETAVVIAPLLTLEVLRHPRSVRLGRLAAVAPLWLVTLVYMGARARFFPSGFGSPLPEGIANVGQFGWGLAWYGKQFVLPFPLTPFHEFPLNPSLGHIMVGLITLGLLLGAATLILRFRPGGLFWIGWIVMPLILPLVPLLFTYRQAAGPVAERYMFISLVPFCALAVKFASHSLAKWTAEGLRRPICVFLCLLACATGGGVASLYGKVFRDDWTYFSHAYTFNPESPFVLQWLAVLEIRENRFQAALSLLDRAMSHDSGMLSLIMNRAFVLTKLNQLPAAEEAYRLAIQRNPLHPGAHFGLASVLQDMGEFEAASHHYREVLKINPQNLAAMGNLGICLYQMNDPAGAVEVWNHALTRQESPFIRFNLGMAYRNLGRRELAQANLRRFLQVADESFAEQRRLALRWLGE